MAKDETIFIEALPPGPGLAFADFYEQQQRQIYKALRLPKECFEDSGPPSSFQVRAFIAQIRKEQLKRERKR